MSRCCPFVVPVFPPIGVSGDGSLKPARAGSRLLIVTVVWAASGEVRRMDPSKVQKTTPTLPFLVRFRTSLPMDVDLLGRCGDDAFRPHLPVGADRGDDGRLEPPLQVYHEAAGA